jgi:hypothetical protein
MNISNRLITLPADVVLEIRSFLYSDSAGSLCDYDGFIAKENCWSWRNFLSVSNSEEWRSVRKDTMIWSLNKYESKRYLRDNSFRAIINDRVQGSKQKIALIYPDPMVYSLTQLHTVLDTSYIGLISVSNYRFTDFPSCRSVHTIILHSTAQLRSLGSYENLAVLKLIGGSFLASIGRMGKLVALALNSVRTSCLFPLEQLISFHLLQEEGKFGQHQHRFTSLEDLTLINGISFSLPTHGSALKKLKSLSLTDYEVANLSGLESLISLSVCRVATLLGKEEIFPQLRKIQGDDYFVKEGINNYPQLNKLVISQLPYNFTVDQFNQSLQFPTVVVSVQSGIRQFREEDLIIGAKVKSVEIQFLDFRGFQGVLPGRYFDEIMLCGNGSFNDVSMFGSTQKVFLLGCSSITDISPLRNVPYLLLNHCDGVKDYSCLGSQHYLEIGDSSRLTDDQLNNFGKIRCLKILRCSQITRIERLTHNLYIDITYCNSVRSAVFDGVDYLNVKLNCTNLAAVSIRGWIYSLSIGCNCSLNPDLLENYTHLDLQK